MRAHTSCAIPQQKPLKKWLFALIVPNLAAYRLVVQPRQGNSFRYETIMQTLS